MESRTFLFTILFILGSISIHAQNFAYDSTQYKADTIEAGEFRGFQLKLWTLDSSGFQFKWTRVTNTLPDEWSYSLCDYASCYAGVPSGGTMSPITSANLQNGQTAFFRLLIATSDSAMSGKVVFYVYDAANPTIGDTISFSLTTVPPVEDTSDVTGVSVNAGREINIYPNPTNAILNLAGNELNCVVVRDMAGAVVLSQSAPSKGALTLDMGGLAIGIYTVAVHSSAGVTYERVVRY